MPNIFELIEKLITERGSASIQRVHIDLLKDQATFLVDENNALKARVAELEELNHRLSKELESNLKRDEFVEHRGMLFKRDSKGGFLETVYCPKCHGPMGAGFKNFPFQCLNCKVIADFKPGDLSRNIIPELERIYG